MNRFRFALFFFSLVLASTAIAQCPPQGLTLTVTGGRLGDPAFLHVSGTPLAPGILGVDVAGGPTLTPVGTTCLGLTSELQLLPFTFGSNGSHSIGVTLPATPALDGLTLFMQAVGAMGVGPNPTLGWSNGATIAFSSPKLVLINPGQLNVPPSPSTPGSYCVYDALTDSPITPAVPLPVGYVRQAISIPELGLVAMLLMMPDRIVVIDANTGALVTTITPPADPGLLSLASDGSSLYVTYEGNLNWFPPWTSSTPGGVRSYSLPSGTPGPTIQLPIGNPDAMLIVPGSSVAYLRHRSLSAASEPAMVLPIDLATGAALPPINLGAGYGAIAEWTLHNGIVYCVTFGLAPFPTSLPVPPPQVALAAFSTTTNAPLMASPAIFTGVSSLRLGPGTVGSPALFLRSPDPTVGLLEISPTTLSVVNTIPVGGYVIDIRLSSAGTEWLLIVLPTASPPGSPMQLVTWAPQAFPPTVISTLAGYDPTVAKFITPLMSATVWKAYFTENGSSIAPFATDPATPPSTAVSLPLTGPGYLVLSN